MNVLNPTRIEFARIRRKWTKARLASELGVDVRSVQGYEAGEYIPEIEKLEQIAEKLRFPISFFFGEDLPTIAEHTASFRSMSKMSKSLMQSALSSGSVAFLLNEWIGDRFTLPDVNVPNLHDLSPEDAAITLRRIWGLGEAPIPNLIHLLESKGIKVFSLALEAREVDAFSVWHKNQPFIFLNTFKSAEHSRFDAAHELGHLVRDSYSMMHAEAAHNPEMEKAANAFASAFLMPRNSVIGHRPISTDLSTLIKLKSFWGVSLAALVYRMNQLGLFTEWTHRTLCIQIATNGYRTEEPNPMQRETSKMLAKVFEMMKAENTSKIDIARDLSILPEDLDSLTFGLVLTGLSSTSDSSKLATNKPAGKLKLVK
ncbi:ImmA/IrrE family metallo-endopeptidase [Methylophilus sp. TWE2]|uniref:helix-turn-helix domain-containing protein n=1 Tax=Methylophilus sp. TWE2 TaxID=1662285 RepID=UPI000670E6BB|nr:XRE family transcriptional regulator [Methylophilus sp. TWE2]AKR42711.1 XRE family transcriptional regulator [Methylophilus sp. TWE2]